MKLPLAILAALATALAIAWVTFCLVEACLHSTVGVSGAWGWVAFGSACMFVAVPAVGACVYQKVKGKK